MLRRVSSHKDEPPTSASPPPSGRRVAARSRSLTSVVCLVFDVLQDSDVTDEKRWQWWNICISGSVRLDLQQSRERAFTLLKHPVAALDVLWFHFLFLKVCWSTFNKSSQPSNIQWQRTDVLHETKLPAVCLTLVTSSADLNNPWLYLYKYQTCVCLFGISSFIFPS